MDSLPKCDAPRQYRDHREMVIEELADREAALEAMLVEALRDAEAFRTLAQQGLHALAALTTAHTKLQQQNRQLLEENRRLRRVPYVLVAAAGAYRTAGSHGYLEAA